MSQSLQQTQTYMATEIPQRILDDWLLWEICDFRPDAGQLVPLQGGLTNRSWLMLLDHQQYVLRQHTSRTRALDIHREQEFQIQQAASAAGIAPAVRYRSPDDSYWIMDFVPGEGLIATSNQLPLKALAKRLGQLHGLPLSKALSGKLDSLNLKEKATHYWAEISQFGNRAPDCAGIDRALGQEIEDRLSELSTQVKGFQPRLCHIDPNPSNWRHSEGRWLLLDWEYAALANPLWDFVCFARMAKLSGRTLEQWARLAGSSKESPEWRQVEMEYDYIAALWYAARGLISLNELGEQLDDLLLRAGAMLMASAH